MPTVAALTQDTGAAPVIPADEYGRGTPSRSGDGFIAAADAGDYEVAAEYLDLRGRQRPNNQIHKFRMTNLRRQPSKVTTGGPGVS